MVLLSSGASLLLTCMHCAELLAGSIARQILAVCQVAGSNSHNSSCPKNAILHLRVSGAFQERMLEHIMH